MHNKKLMLIISLGILVVLVAITSFVSRDSVVIDSYEEEGSAYDSSSYVVLKDPDNKLSNEIMTPNYKLVFSENIRVYAEREYEEYGENSVIGYLIKGVGETEDKKLRIAGRFGLSSVDEVFYVTTMKNNVLMIEYQQNDVVIFDDTLPSNTKYNQFIGLLPLETDEYTIDYSIESDTFLVTLFSSSRGYENATDTILEQTGAENIEDLNVSYTGRTGMPSPYW